MYTTIKYCLSIILFFRIGLLVAQSPINNTPIEQPTKFVKQEQFYDSLQHKATHRKFTGWLYDVLISPPHPFVDKKNLAINYFAPYEGKIIKEIQIKPLDVFGPTFEDTTAAPYSKAARIANKIHTKSNLKTIQKLLLFEVGDPIDPETMYENERIIRELSYIKDVRFLISQDSIFSGFVKVTILTKDRFSYGISGDVNNPNSGDIKVYNKNIFGIGHEISVKFVGHATKSPYLGVETYYKIRNIAGNYLDIQLGYLNTYRRNGIAFNLNRSIFSSNIKWGYGIESARMFRTNYISDNDPVHVDEPMNLCANDAWVGRNFSFTNKAKGTTEFTITGGINNWYYFETPVVAEENSHFFANRTLYLLGLNLTQRNYLQDQLIYSYGITEDIPIGFKNEFIYGYDANEFGDRHFLQFSVTTGKKIKRSNGYVFTSFCISSFLKHKHFEEGEIYTDFNLISKLRTSGSKKTRSFFDINYTLGIERYDIESLSLDSDYGLRGFHSNTASGKQRLNMKLEHVVFLPKQFYKFSMAVYGFCDLGIIGSNKKNIFDEDYYSGIGLGVRIHNENLVFETIRFRIAFYPFAPKDVNNIGFLLDEQSKQKFSSLEPTAPTPITFE